jgi:hypothetical protein
MDNGTKGQHVRDKAKRFSAATAWTKGGLAALLVLLLALVVLPAGSSAFAEEETHVFDATLSLTGTCATNVADPTPDPGTCPGVAGVDHPPKRFKVPRNIATDEYGDIYIANKAIIGEDSQAVIDVFGPTGNFITEIPDHRGAERVAVDSEGNVYALRSYHDTKVVPFDLEAALVLYRPKVYEPQLGKIEYGAPTYVAASEEGTAQLVGLDAGLTVSVNSGIAVDRSDDHLYLDARERIYEFGPAADGNPLLDAHVGGTTRVEYEIVTHHYDSEGKVTSLENKKGPIGEELPKNKPDTEFVRNGEGKVVEEIRFIESGSVVRQGSLRGSRALAVDAATGNIYAGTEVGTTEDPEVVNVLDGTPEHPLLRTISGSCLPEGHFGSNSVGLSVAVDESNGHVFVDDRASGGLAKPVYEFTETGECVSTIEHSFEFAFSSEIAIDNGAHSPNGGLNSSGRYLYVPSGEIGTKSHVYAFGPVAAAHTPPKVESSSASNVTETEAQLHAKINPEGSATEYRFEYTTQQSFESEGFEGATLAGEGTIASGTVGISVATPASGLLSGTTYRFRVLATSCEEAGPACEDEAQGSFATYPAPATPATCPNEPLRVGLSATLPDCRAFELVTPANTNGHSPLTPSDNSAGEHFGTPPASPAGNSLAFLIVGGAIPGYPGAGGFNGDLYVAARTPTGWQTEGASPSGPQSSNPLPGGLSPDHHFAATGTGGADFGSLPIEGKRTDYIRYPDGSYRLVGRGGQGTDPGAEVRAISAEAGHILFTATLPLELDSPPSGSKAIYDRTPDEVTHVVSLLPEDITPAAGKPAIFEGASADGSAVAFTVGPGASPLYLRIDDERTVELAGSGATFAGVSADGRYAFYTVGGNLNRLDTETEVAEQITTSNDATVVNVPAGGTSVYFISPSVLSGEEQNPNGTEAQLGEENLYYWDGSTTRFVAAVTPRDVEGEYTAEGGQLFDGLGLWAPYLPDGESSTDPSRTTPDGGTLLFQSRADLAGYESGGASEVYRYYAGENSLSCLSCLPTHQPAAGDASLQTVRSLSGEQASGNAFAQIPNLSPTGDRAFFESPDPLVLADADGVQDVYEWEANGTGSCTTPGGCVSLISSGDSARANYLFGVSESGDDAFISTSDLLLPSDPDEAPTVYDARVEGGFAEASGPPAECLGEACQPAAVAPEDPTPASASFQGAGNVKEGTPTAARCPKGKRMVRKAGKSRCVPKHNKPQRKHHKRAGTNRRAGR